MVGQPIGGLINLIVTIVLGLGVIAMAWERAKPMLGGGITAKAKQKHADKLAQEKEEVMVEVRRAIEEHTSVLQEEIKRIEESMDNKTEVNKQLTLTMARVQIEDVYKTNKDRKKLHFHSAASMETMYQTYTSLGGNSYITKLVNEMREWEYIE